MTALVIASLILSLAWLALWRLTTSSERVARVTDEGLGYFLEIGIYRDHPAVMVRSLADLFVSSIKLGRLLLPPSVLFLLPCLLVVPYLASVVGDRPLRVGEQTVLSVTSSEPVNLEFPPGLVAETGPIHDPTRQDFYWRLRGESPGVYRVRLLNSELTKTVRVEESGPVNERRTPDWKHWLLHPTERPLPYGTVEEIRIDYPDRIFWAAGRQVHWGWLLFIGFLFWTAVLLSLERVFRDG